MILGKLAEATRAEEVGFGILRISRDFAVSDHKVRRGDEKPGRPPFELDHNESPGSVTIGELLKGFDPLDFQGVEVFRGLAGGFDFPVIRTAEPVRGVQVIESAVIFS